MSMNSKQNKIYVTQPSMPPLDEFIKYLGNIWKNKILTNGGDYHKQLEAEICNYLGVDNISLFNNGTIALVTALQAARISGEVITTPFSFVATSHAILWNGAKPVFVDIDPISLNIDPKKIEAAITQRTTAILPVHCYGIPCDMVRIEEIAQRYNLRVIYDAAHAFGVEQNGNTILNNGDMTVLSFHATKVFNTFEGGAIISKNRREKERIDNLKNFGIVDEINVTLPGINGKMSEINAAFGILQLKYLDENINKRSLIDAQYRWGFRNIPGIRCVERKVTKDNYAYFPIIIDPDFKGGRDAAYERLKKEEIIARKYFYPLISHFPMYAGLESAKPSNLTVAEKIASNILCLPIYPDLEQKIVNKIIQIIKE